VRLFVGIDVPEAVGDALVRAAPGPAPGIRSVGKRDLHLTLHFIGKGDEGRVQEALESIRAAAFSLEVTGLGQFKMRGGRRILWAGVGLTPDLLRLHRQVGSALAETGFEAEVRAYRPHVTLARVGRPAKAAAIERLIETRRDASFGRFEVADFILYDTEAPDAPVRYRRICRYALIPAPEHGAGH
jgi:2'-5' RNA ligase